MKPIMFSTPMVRAILEGRKTMTRRVVKPQPVLDNTGMSHWKNFQWDERVRTEGGRLGLTCVENHARYHSGDILWVREKWGRYLEYTSGTPTWTYAYFADSKERYPMGRDETGREFTVPVQWRSPMFMPKEAARIFLRVTDVRLERLQDMTTEDCTNDGDFAPEAVDAVGVAPLFGALWDSLRKPADRAKYGWDANPWVWVIRFERTEKPC